MKCLDSTKLVLLLASLVLAAKAQTESPSLQNTVNSLTSQVTAGATHGIFSGLQNTISRLGLPGFGRPNGTQANWMNQQQLPMVQGPMSPEQQQMMQMMMMQQAMNPYYQMGPMPPMYPHAHPHPHPPHPHGMPPGQYQNFMRQQQKFGPYGQMMQQPYGMLMMDPQQQMMMQLALDPRLQQQQQMMQPNQQQTLELMQQNPSMQQQLSLQQMQQYLRGRMQPNSAQQQQEITPEILRQLMQSGQLLPQQQQQMPQLQQQQQIPQQAQQAQMRS